MLVKASSLFGGSCNLVVLRERSMRGLVFDNNGRCLRNLSVYLWRGCTSGVRSFCSGGVENPAQMITREPASFLSRHIGPCAEEIKAMLDHVKCPSLDKLVEETIPEAVRLKEDRCAWHKTPANEIPLFDYEEQLTEDNSENLAVNTNDLPTSFATQAGSRSSTHQFLQDAPLPETDAMLLLKKIASQNKIYKTYIGQGYHPTILPAVIRRNLLENPTWYTAYTPYQAEIAQGRLEALLIFQTVVTELTGMEIANASLLDEASAAAEAMAMICRLATKSSSSNPESKTHKPFFLASTLHPQIIDVVRTRADPLGVPIIVGDPISLRNTSQLCGAMVQYPNTEGTIESYDHLAERIHAQGGMLVVVADPLSLCVLRPPAEFGADVVVGSMQRFGAPLGFGGPHAAYFATKRAYIRSMPGRIIGRSRDVNGRLAYRMVLQTREQHIRKEKATSNICTSQALLANLSAMYAVYHGPIGLFKMALRIRHITNILRQSLINVGYSVLQSHNFFDSLKIFTAPLSARVVVEALRQKEINVRYFDCTAFGVTLDEMTTPQDIQELVEILASLKGSKGVMSRGVGGELGGQHARGLNDGVPNFMSQQIFNMIQTETEMLRFLKHLEKKDLGLNTSMISLGSCTMKLNPTTALQTILWPLLANIHPFAPEDQTRGYQKLLFQMSNYLAEITGLPAVSVQPNSGATGEFAGLMAIRAYHNSIGEYKRTVCLIPASAHGTNAASAAMAGMTVKIVKQDKNGNVDVDEIERLAEKYKDTLSCLMVTYPSTHGIFEPSIDKICDMVHAAGAMLYMDGANLNAQMMLTSPGKIGADICHLNLHKTFAIPHGGGGPGVGPICAIECLRPFLPGHSYLPNPHKPGRAVAAAPYGSALVLPISWTFITMLGRQGLKRSAQVAILNANYMMCRLKDYFTVKFVKHRCGHEFILDVSSLRKFDITEEDIAKRLMDYGFHAPTMSWPVQASLMIEPTESESKRELDRFCDALIAIRHEVGKLESGEWPRDNNPLKRAPHTVDDVCADDWDRPYTREEAALVGSRRFSSGKFWPSVGRVNNLAGEKNPMCDCGNVADYVT